VDVTTWPRCDAECSPERGLYYHPSRQSAGQPTVAGWAFQWICQLGFARDSWTAPVDAARLHPMDDTDQHAARQVRALLARLPGGGPVPWFVFDAGHDSAQLTLDLTDAGVVVLVRLRANRCFYDDPPPRPPGATGRPRRHGAKFAFADPATWPTPTTTHVATDDQYGTVTVQAWAGLHPKQHRHPGHGSGAPRPIVRGTILRVQLERIPARTRPPKVLWLGTVASGPQVPPACSKVEPLPVQTAVRSAQSDQSWHRRWRSGPLVEDAGVSDRQLQQCPRTSWRPCATWSSGWLCRAGPVNVAAALRRHARDPRRALTTLGIRSG
jgi:hypothetical protein